MCKRLLGGTEHDVVAQHVIGDVAGEHHLRQCNHLGSCVRGADYGIATQFGIGHRIGDACIRRCGRHGDEAIVHNHSNSLPFYESQIMHCGSA